MDKTPAGEKSTDSPFKDRRFTKNHLPGVARKEGNALKRFARKVRGEK